MHDPPPFRNIFLTGAVRAERHGDGRWRWWWKRALRALIGACRNEADGWWSMVGGHGANIGRQIQTTRTAEGEVSLFFFALRVSPLALKGVLYTA